MLIRVVIILSLPLLCATCAETVTLKPDHEVSNDAFFCESDPTRNYEGDGIISVQPPCDTHQRLQAYLEFTELDDYLGWQVDSAELRLYINNVVSYGSWFLAAGDAAWDENTLNWDNRPGAVAGSEVEHVNPTQMETWLSLNVTTHVEEWLDGSLPNHGFHLYDNDWWSSYWSAIAADEGGDFAKFPQLILDIEDSAVEPVSWGVIKALE
ncbi:MAG: DNRLRE domain-containing protein [Candidatus Coatesbacteria bacterium]|nr:DNRLRE domain-containing protein [Candidatus Coatesbacteria bacterium]